MLLRKKLFGLAGTLMLAVSPTAIVLVQDAMAQDAQAPTTEAPTPGAKPSVEDILKRHKKGAGQDGEGAPAKRAAPADAQDQDGGTPAPKPKRQKPGAEPDGAAPGSGADEAPAAKPQRQKQAPEAAGQEAPGETAPGEAPPAAKPKRQKPAPDTAGQEAPNKPAPDKPAAEKPAPGQPTAGEPSQEAPAAKPKRQKPAASGENTGQDTPAAKPKNESGQPEPVAKPTAPAQPNVDQGAATAPAQPKPLQPAAGGGQPAVGQENGDTPEPRGKRRDRTQGQPANDGSPQGVEEGQPRNRPENRPLDGRNQLPGQGGIPLPADGTQQGQDRRPGSYPQPDNGNQQGQGRPLQGPVDRAAEQRAIGLLGDTTPPDRLNNQQLRQRLNVYRSALATGNLSEATEQALIQRLNGARAALRNRMADQEYGGEQQQQGQAGRGSPFGRSQFRQGSPRPQDIPAILADRRPSNVLTVDQLNRRILVYRDASNDERYNPEDREAFAQYLRDDRNDLRRRLLSDRGQRTDRLRGDENGRRFDMDINPRGQRYQSVWAAEVDDDQIEQQFAARPLKPLPRRYPRAEFLARPEVVMEQPAVRQSIPGVELDTIHFGFNESFVREEEIANLDRIGRILERIVAAHPGEVFVIEGNTDAVGDDAYNLRLSKERAEAVKQALTQYYVISPDNLVTAGLGERYLKIPTPEPEQENRRVTLRRITPLLEK